jgi:hypothetical protein
MGIGSERRTPRPIATLFQGFNPCCNRHYVKRKIEIKVAKQLQRQGIGIEILPEYFVLAESEIGKIDIIF